MNSSENKSSKYISVNDAKLLVDEKYGSLEDNRIKFINEYPNVDFFEFYLAGVLHRSDNAQSYVFYSSYGISVTFKKDIDNEYSNTAVKVMKDRLFLGFVAESHSSQICDMIDQYGENLKGIIIHNTYFYRSFVDVDFNRMITIIAFAEE